MDINFVTVIREYITTHHLLSDGNTIIVGLSGGADSVALLSILHELGYNCVAAHCNFHLRGEESNRDELYCRKLCDRLNVRLLVNNFDVDTYRNRTGESVEMACRTLRYDWWHSLLQSGVGSVIAVGHHKEDNVETFFLNMLRGCGLNGLKGMLPKSGNVIRPLLNISRRDIERYLNHQRLSYVNDSTNAENDYGRNKLRNIIIPEIEHQFQGAMDSICKTLNCLQGNYELYTDYVAELRRKYVSSDNSINISKIVTDEPHPRMVLFELLSPMGFNITQVSNVLSAIDDSGSCMVSGKQFVSAETTMLLDRGYLRPCCSPAVVAVATREVSLTDAPFSSSIITKAEFDSLKESRKLTAQAIYLDASILETPHKFTLRGWQSGDRLAPFGMKGSKLLSDLFSDSKIPVDKKNTIPVLLCDDKIIWVIGIRASRHFAVSPATEQVLVVNYNLAK